MATTTNYGWETPDDTDLVKDGAAAIRTLGSSVDTTTKALNPETTLGDLAYRSATANTNVRLSIGTTGQILAVNAGVPAWTTPAAGGAFTSLATGTLSGTSVALTAISGSYINLYLVVDGISTTSNASVMKLRLNGASGATDYIYNGEYISGVSNSGYGGTGDSSIGCFADVDIQAADTVGKLVVNVPNYTATTSFPIAQGYFAFKDATAHYAGRYVGTLMTAGAITQLTLLLSTGSFDGGTYTLYGEK